MTSKKTLPIISSNCSHLVHSSESLLRSGQLFNNVISSNNLHTDQYLVIDSSQNKQKSNIQDSNNLPLNGLIGTSQSNIDCQLNVRSVAASCFGTVSRSVGSGPQDDHQSNSAYFDSILKNGNSSITGPGLQDVRAIGQKSDFNEFKSASNSVFAGQDSGFSNVELKLGQPHQNSKYSDQPTLGPQLLDAVVNPSKLVFPEQMIHNSASRRLLSTKLVLCCIQYHLNIHFF